MIKAKEKRRNCILGRWAGQPPPAAARGGGGCERPRARSGGGWEGGPAERRGHRQELTRLPLPFAGAANSEPLPASPRRCKGEREREGENAWLSRSSPCSGSPRETKRGRGKKKKTKIKNINKSETPGRGRSGVTESPNFFCSGRARPLGTPLRPGDGLSGGGKRYLSRRRGAPRPQPLRSRARRGQAAPPPVPTTTTPPTPLHPPHTHPLPSAARPRRHPAPPPGPASSPPRAAAGRGSRPHAGSVRDGAPPLAPLRRLSPHPPPPPASFMRRGGGCQPGAAAAAAGPCGPGGDAGRRDVGGAAGPAIPPPGPGPAAAPPPPPPRARPPPGPRPPLRQPRTLFSCSLFPGGQLPLPAELPRSLPALLIALGNLLLLTALPLFFFFVFFWGFVCFFFPQCLTINSLPFFPPWF